MLGLGVKGAHGETRVALAPGVGLVKNDIPARVDIETDVQV